MSFFGWFTKPRFEVSLLDSLTAVFELGILLFLVTFFLVYLEAWRKKKDRMNGKGH